MGFRAYITMHVAAALGLSLLLLPRLAFADGPLGPNGAPITTSNYTVDLYRGPVLGSSRMVGLGGAFVSIAEGVEGALVNPAAAGYRQPQWPEWYDYWLAFSFTYPFGSGDFFNNGTFLGDQATVSDDNFFFFVTGFLVQFLQGGVGLTIDNQTTTATTTAASTNGMPTDLRFGITTYHIPFGYGFLDGQLIVGAGMRFLQERLRVGGLDAFDGELGYKTMGIGAEFGLQIKPEGKRWRVGASFFPKITTKFGADGVAEVTPEGDIKIGEIFVPRSTVDPHRGSVGFSYVFGPRPTNPPWVSQEEFAADDLKRLKNLENEVRRRQQEVIKQAQEEGGPEAELKIRDINAKTKFELGRIEEWRDNIMHWAWETLRNRYRNEWPRRYLLIATEVKITGKVSEGVGVVSFIAQTVQRSGQKISVSPRLGLEGEVWPKRMKLRAGTYWEPSRFEQTKGRQHGTLGIDIRVVNWNVFGLWPDDYLWQIAFSVDIARDYQVFSLGIGGWY